MGKLATDSSVCRRIVRAFVDFLDHVEPAAGVDIEGLEVARDCLLEAFRINQFTDDDLPEPNALVNIFCSQNGRAGYSGESSTMKNSADGDLSRESISQETNGVREDYTPGVEKDELFGHFFSALEKSQFFRPTASGDDVHALLDRATHMFHDAVGEMERSGCSTFDQRTLADTLKTLGNKAMQFKLYADAIERYTCAIALCEKNAIYYCNRAAAYTQIHKYSEAINDCLKSIELDPNYSKAYSRLGLAYYAQGNYGDALHKGFRKALELDPDNDTVKENIKAAEQKLREQEQSGHRQESRNQFNGGPPSFASVSFDTSSLPAGLASMFMNMVGDPHNAQTSESRPAEENEGGPSVFMSMPFEGGAVPDLASMFVNMGGQASQGQSFESGSTEGNNGSRSAPPFTSADFNSGAMPDDLASMLRNLAGNQQQSFSRQSWEAGSGGTDGFDDPGISVGGNVSVNLGGDTPEEVSRALRSVMGMFSGMPQGDAPHNSDGR